MCCVEGDGGAPLLDFELDIIKGILPKLKPYLPADNLLIIEKDGFFYRDDDEFCTMLVENRQCVFVCFENDVAKCAIEKLFEAGDTDFQKPISCHLYPVRVTDYKDFAAVNFHWWKEVCGSALTQGLPLYQMLQKPLIRRFGKDWYDELLSHKNNINN
jgi:hypothetical protein